MLYIRNRGDSMSFGNVLSILIEERGVTQKELAEACSTSPSAISGYVLNTREPDFDMLRKIAEYFHVSTDYLLEYENASVKSDDEVVRSIVKTMSPGQRSLWIKQGKQLQDYDIRAMEDASNTDH